MRTPVKGMIADHVDTLRTGCSVALATLKLHAKSRPYEQVRHCARVGQHHLQPQSQMAMRICCSTHVSASCMHMRYTATRLRTAGSGGGPAAGVLPCTPPPQPSCALALLTALTRPLATCSTFVPAMRLIHIDYVLDENSVPQSRDRINQTTLNHSCHAGASRWRPSPHDATTTAGTSYACGSHVPPTTPPPPKLLFATPPWPPYPP